MKHDIQAFKNLAETSHFCNIQYANANSDGGWSQWHDFNGDFPVDDHGGYRRWRFKPEYKTDAMLGFKIFGPHGVLKDQYFLQGTFHDWVGQVVGNSLRVSPFDGSWREYMWLNDIKRMEENREADFEGLEIEEIV